MIRNENEKYVLQGDKSYRIAVTTYTAEKYTDIGSCYVLTNFCNKNIPLLSFF